MSTVSAPTPVPPAAPAAAHHEPRHDNPMATPVQRRPSLDFSLTGLVYCAMMVFMGLAAINTQANLLFGVFGLMIGILLVSGTISRLVLKRLRVRRVLPDHAVVGRPMAATYEFTNDKRFWPSLSVLLSEWDGADGFTRQPQCYLLHVAPGMTASVSVQAMPRRRGVTEFRRFQLSTSFPFGFVKRAAVRAQADHLLIRPPLADVDRRLIRLCRSADNTGATVRPRPGGMDEFYGVKEHRPGESPRRIYWKRSARTGVLVSKEMAQVAPPRLMILVDTHLPTRSLEQHALVERAIAMAGSLATAALLEDELAVGLCAWSDGGWVKLAPSRGKRHHDDVLSALAKLPLNTSHASGELLEESRSLLRGGTTGVLFTPKPMQASRIDQARGRLVIVSAGSQEAEGWFRFDPAVDFATAMPPDQQPGAARSPKMGHRPDDNRPARAGGRRFSFAVIVVMIAVALALLLLLAKWLA